MSQTDVEPNRRSTPRTPRWVQVFGIIFIALVLLFVVLHLTGLSPMGSHMNMSNMNMSSTQQEVQQP